MYDDMVLRAKQFVNTTYGDRIGMTVEVDGRPRWDVMFALTRALQWELGVGTLSNSFGPATLSALTAKYPVLNAATVPNADFCRIIQSALYCKGYRGGGIDGFFNNIVQEGLSKMKSEMGVSDGTPDLMPKLFKALLAMDPYVVVGTGTEAVRSVQQWLNGRYLNRRDFFAIPCDGRNSRDVAKSMLFAIQYELGMADGVANGTFGPGTKTGLRANTVSIGEQGIWVSLFTAAMMLNQRSVPFSSSFDAALGSDVRVFQEFVRLPPTGRGDFQTWASLLVSYGDQDRKGEACDGVTRITPDRASALKSQGVKYVGRYLTSVSSTLPEKVIQPGELQTMADTGLRCFPTYQTYGRDASSFGYAQAVPPPTPQRTPPWITASRVGRASSSLLTSTPWTTR